MGDRTGKPLVECPVCKTPVEHTKHIGLRDFTWVNSKLPGRIGGMDIDFCLTEVKSGRVLMISLRAPGEPINTGERLSYQTFVRMGCDVWYVWETRNGRVRRGISDSEGRAFNIKEFTVEQLANLVTAWWAEVRG